MVKKITPLICILILAIALRLVNINQSLWLDEAAQAIMSSKSVESILFDRGGDFHPPLFYLLAHYWQQLGSSDTWLRLLPISFGVLTIVVFYFLTGSLYPSKEIKVKSLKIKVNNLASFLLAIAPFHIYYSQEYRSYSLVCLLATTSMWLLVKKKFLLLGLINCLLLYTHYSSVFFLLAQAIYVFLYDRRDIKLMLGSWILSLIIYVPWLPQFFTQAAAGLGINSQLPGWREVLSLSPIKATPLVIFKLIAGRINIFPKSAYIIYVVLVLGATMAAALLAKVQSKLLFIWVFVPLFSMILVSFIAPQTQPFRLIYLLPGLLLLFIEAMFRSPKTFLAIMLYISIFGNVLYFTRPRLQREQWHPAAEFLANTSSTIIIKFPEPFAPLQWYQPELAYLSVLPTLPANPASVTAMLEQQVLPTNLLLVDYLTGLTDPNLLVESKLIDLGYTKGTIHNFEGVGFISEYSK